MGYFLAFRFKPEVKILNYKKGFRILQDQVGKEIFSYRDWGGRGGGGRGEWGVEDEIWKSIVKISFPVFSFGGKKQVSEQL